MRGIPTERPVSPMASGVTPFLRCADEIKLPELHQIIRYNRILLNKKVNFQCLAPCIIPEIEFGEVNTFCPPENHCHGHGHHYGHHYGYGHGRGRGRGRGSGRGSGSSSS